MTKRLPQVSERWKERLARVVKNPVMQRLMQWGIQLFVPRHRVGVAVVVSDGKGRVLMLRHVFHPDFPWGLPGGWLGRNEDPASGALRELREETGLRAGPLMPVITWYDRTPPHLGIIFRVDLDPAPLVLSSEILEGRWFPAASIPHGTTSYTRKAIAAAFDVDAMPLTSSPTKTMTGIGHSEP